jgi:hypothetical protein
MAVNVTPRMQLIDMKTGQLTRDGYLLIASLTDAVADATSDFVRIDAVQTLTNKTLDGDANTFTDIPTSGLATKTGTGTRVVTASAAGTSGRIAEWDANGNLVGTTNIADYATTAAVALKQDAGAIVILPTYTVAGVPAAVSNTRGLIYVSNETGGATVAFSDGTNWRRVQDRAIIS